MLATILDEPLNPWQRGTAAKDNIVLSSRIRLARNMKGILFTNRGDEESLAKVEKMMKSLRKELKDDKGQEFLCIDMDKLSERDREILVEKHLVSPVFADNVAHKSVLIASDASVAIMVNEEDHVRIQCMEKGLALDKAYERAVAIDDTIESQCDYAFSERFGYLTSCPTNVGTGLRASVMVHLPALALTGRLQRIIKHIVQLGFSVRGLYGEGSEALGNVYQVSNQMTLGISESDTIDQLTKVVDGLVSEEEKSRIALSKGDWEAFEDRVWRAYGLLSNARRLSGEEALSLASDVQLGRDLGVLPKGKENNFEELMVITRPHFLSKYANREEMTAKERDGYRAKVVRERIQ